MKSPGLLFLSFFLVNLAFGQQFPSQVWHEGKVQLEEGGELAGKVKYDLDNNLVQITDGRTVDTFSPLQVRSFEIFDEQFGDYRYFYSLPFLGEAIYERPIFFEVLFEGQLTLLAREYIITENGMMRNNPWMMGPGAFWWPYQRLSFRYYLVSVRDGKVIEYNQKKKMLMDYMGNRDKEVEEYIRNNNLKTDRRSDLVKIVAYFNGLIG
jgi:hypothetical protein